MEVLKPRLLVSVGTLAYFPPFLVISTRSGAMFQQQLAHRCDVVLVGEANHIAKWAEMPRAKNYIRVSACLKELLERFDALTDRTKIRELGGCIFVAC